MTLWLGRRAGSEDWSEVEGHCEHKDAKGIDGFVCLAM